MALRLAVRMQRDPLLRGLGFAGSAVWGLRALVLGPTLVRLSDVAGVAWPSLHKSSGPACPIPSRKDNSPKSEWEACRMFAAKSLSL